MADGPAGSIDSKEDAHDRVAVLFIIPADDAGSKETRAVASVKWLLEHGVPTDPETGAAYEYEGTYIIQ